MHLFLSAIIVLGAITNLVIGTGFLVNPITSGGDFGLHVATTHGSSTLRGDMTAFFYVSAISMAWGAWQRRGDVLLPALALFVIAFTGRLINLVIEGSYEGWWLPMTIEALHILILTFAIRAWGLRRATRTRSPSAGTPDR